MLRVDVVVIVFILSVYNRVDDYAEAASHATIGKKAIDIHVQHIRSAVSELERLISGARSRYAAGHTLHTMGGPSRLNMLDSCHAKTSTGENTETGGAGVSNNPSILQNPGRWVDLEKAYVDAMRIDEADQGGPDSKGSKKGPAKQAQQKEKKARGKTTGGVRGQKGKGGQAGVAPVPVVVHSIPPSFAPIPCKPIFYDIALNHLENDVTDILDDRCGVKKRGGSQAARGGATVSSAPGESTTGIVGAAQSLFGWFSGR